MTVTAEEVESTRHAVRDFVNRVLLPLESSIRPGELAGEERDRVRALAKESGLWLLDAPSELGGADLGMEMRCAVWEELARAAVLEDRESGIFGPEVGPMLAQATGKTRDEYLTPVVRGELKTAFAQTEPSAGSDPAGMRTRADWTGSEWVLNGEKHFITAAGDADFLQVVAVTSRDDNTGRPQFTVLLVDTDSPGVTVGGPDVTFDDELTWRIHFDDVKVPADRVLGEVGRGFRAAQSWLIVGRLRQAARALGIAGRALEMAIEHAKQREMRDGKMFDFQAIRFMLVDSHLELKSARLFVYDVARRADSGEDVRFDAAGAKILAVEAGTRVCDRAIQIHGGGGLMKELPLSGWFWNLRGLKITEGTTEVLRDYISRSL